jgi:hypothetical protein
MKRYDMALNFKDASTVSLLTALSVSTTAHDREIDGFRAGLYSTLRSFYM